MCTSYSELSGSENGHLKHAKFLTETRNKIKIILFISNPGSKYMYMYIQENYMVLS